MPTQQIKINGASLSEPHLVSTTRKFGVCHGPSTAYRVTYRHMILRMHHCTTPRVYSTQLGGCARLTQLLRLLHREELLTKANEGLLREWARVASKRSELLCSGYYSCSTVLLLYCSLLHYKSVVSGFLSPWVGLLSNRVGLLSNGVGLLSGERVLQNTPTPSLSSHLRSSPMGVFSRAYGNPFT